MSTTSKFVGWVTPVINNSSVVKVYSVYKLVHGTPQFIVDFPTLDEAHTYITNRRNLENYTLCHRY